MGATSTGWPGRPRGVLWPKLSTFSAGIVDGMRGVQIGPGATLLNLMPRSPRSCAAAAAKLAMAALVTSYGSSVGVGLSELTELVAMTDEPGLRCGRAALVRWKRAEILVANV